MSPLRPTAFLALLITAQAQQRVAERDGWCDEDHGRDRDRGFFCEVREMTLPANRTVIAVDAEPNGGIYVEGWDRNEIRLRAKVSAHARTDEDARCAPPPCGARRPDHQRRPARHRRRGDPPRLSVAVHGHRRGEVRGHIGGGLEHVGNRVHRD